MSPRCLSVFLPVYNAQSSLPSLAADLLEVLPELGLPFELSIVDDGSTDDTAEAAHDLRARFPQLQVLRHPVRMGRPAIVRSGLAATRGDAVLVCEEGCRLEFRDLPKLLKALGEFEAVLATAGGGEPAWGSWAQRVRQWRLRDGESRPVEMRLPGYQLFRRRALQAMRNWPADIREVKAELSNRGLAWQELEVRLAKPALPVAAPQGRPMPLPARLDPKSSALGSKEAARPKYLSKIRDFALGE